eukprot:TRINITY_DN2975_c0_g1_i1.p1 TRINITY_DN2975_c0_g1~~TRINITY_DN2975_c0_g1_i1.p1  ORF type:complete len:485 (+),score=85.25 TRINITY_DN2975_c0_g1_i1:146-1600(+)
MSMLSKDEFERNLKRDYGSLFTGNSAQPLNELFSKPAVPQVSNSSLVKSKRELLWEAKKRRREERNDFSKELIHAPARVERTADTNLPLTQSFQVYPQPTPDDLHSFDMKRHQEVPLPSQEDSCTRQGLAGIRATSAKNVAASRKSSGAAQLRPAVRLEDGDGFGGKERCGGSEQLFGDVRRLEAFSGARPEFGQGQGVDLDSGHRVPFEFQAQAEVVAQMPVPQSREEARERPSQDLGQRVNPELEKKKRYLEELKQQLEWKEQKAKEEKMRKIKEERAELQKYQACNPFGKAGAGAPLRDKYGNIRATIRRPISEEKSLEAQAPRPMNNPYSPPYNPPLNNPLPLEQRVLPPPYQLPLEQYNPPFEQYPNSYLPPSNPNPAYQNYPHPSANPMQVQYPVQQSFPADNFASQPQPLYEQRLPPPPSFPSNPPILPNYHEPATTGEEGLGGVQGEVPVGFITRAYDPEKAVSYTHLTLPTNREV